MRIVNVRVHPVSVARRYATMISADLSAGRPGEMRTMRGLPGSVERTVVSHYYVVELETDTGLVGLGEASDISPRATLPDGRPLRAPLLADRLRRYVVGRDPFQLERLAVETDTPAFPFRSQIATAIDVACHDLAGKATGQPVLNLLGGRFHDRLPVCWIAYIRTPEAMEAEIAEKVAEGFRAFKLKVGTDIAVDEERVALVRRLAGDDAHIKLDANGAWSVDEAIVNMRRLEKYRPAAIETPIPAGDLEAMRQVKTSIGTPYMEHAGPPAKTLEYVRAGVVDVLKISPGGIGGLRRAQKVVAIAEAGGVEAYVGSTVEMGLGTVALGHFAAASAACRWPCDLRGPLLLVDDVLNEPVTYHDGCLQLPDGPGLGVSLNRAKLAQLTGDLP
ncbi:MAG: mandelate racemase/muconate lactonizing enzyme family protein [Chloroflexi bacterium]|nr:mandelate racemase/muconate lactonizing enzyme family protein [Chloroflexota bacterium]